MTVAAALLFALAPSAQNAAAQEGTSRCDPANAGLMELQAGVRCVCVHAREGRISQTPAGWRWDCGILRGRNNADIEASPEVYEGPLPSSVYIDEGWHERSGERGRDRERTGRDWGPEHEAPAFHDRARDRSWRERPDDPDRLSPPVGR